MPEDDSSTGAPLSSSGRCVSRSDRSNDEPQIHLSIDLVSAARWHLSFLKSLSACFSLGRSAVLESIRRYKNLWMPLLCDLSEKSTKTPMILPPFDIQFVWHCHCLKPNHYREFCAVQFGRLLERPAIFDQGNEEYAADLCREIWTERYPSESFDLEIKPEEEQEEKDDEIFSAVCRFRDLCSLFSDPFMAETVYLVSAKQRYKNFLDLSKNHAELIPTSDVLLMWLTHQSFPGIYERDMAAIFGTVDFEFDEKLRDHKMEETKKVWEQAFDEPYDLSSSSSKDFFYWDCSSSPSDSESNRKYKTLQPRSLMEVSVFLKGKEEDGKMLLRVKTIRCNKEMKLERKASGISSSSWEKSWVLCCEFATKGLILDLCIRGGSCIGNSKTIKSLSFSWNELLRAPSLAMEKQLGDKIKAMVAITPPIQAPYLLKFVPDRVTDDKGSMISDEILRMNQYHPQVGRWISRTVLDCYGRECFVVRLRAGEGIWRRGAETPRAVKKEERKIEVREGSWSYLASSIGVAPHKIVATAELKEGDHSMMTWNLSTGEILRIRWRKDLEIEIENENEQVRIELGRKLGFQIGEETPGSGDEEFFTFIRFSEENPAGRATALLNWRALAVEFLPEEDAAFVLLVSMAIVLALTEMKTEDVGHLLIRRRVKEAMAGIEDWGSATVQCGSDSCYPRPWFSNPREFFSLAAMENAAQLMNRCPPAYGKEEIYRQAIGLSGDRNTRER